MSHNNRALTIMHSGAAFLTAVVIIFGLASIVSAVAHDSALRPLLVITGVSGAISLLLFVQEIAFVQLVRHFRQTDSTKK